MRLTVHNILQVDKRCLTEELIDGVVEHRLAVVVLHGTVNRRIAASMLVGNGALSMMAGDLQRCHFILSW